VTAADVACVRSLQRRRWCLPAHFQHCFQVKPAGGSRRLDFSACQQIQSRDRGRVMVRPCQQKQVLDMGFEPPTLARTAKDNSSTTTSPAVARCGPPRGTCWTTPAQRGTFQQRSLRRHRTSSTAGTLGHVSPAPPHQSASTTSVSLHRLSQRSHGTARSVSVPMAQPFATTLQPT
jgi:hypothetical protein